MLWQFTKKILFSLPPELAHVLSLNSLKILYQLNLINKKYAEPKTIMGLKFPNPIGLAAGLDKNGDYIDALGACGFGFIEVGTVTPRPQSGNSTPRLFRLPEHRAIVNRMGFNNKGVDHLVERLKKRKYAGVVGANIGKNFDTPIEQAVSDYVFCFQKVASYADYVTLNISSPNTKNLRDLQQPELLENLLRTLKDEQKIFFTQHQKYVPLVVKVSPDLTQDEIEPMASIFIQTEIDGVIATNTTNQFATISNETGGLSGEPLREKSSQVLREFKKLLGDKMPLIGCGGIFSKEDMDAKYQNGASLVQVYTGLIYQGPAIVAALSERKMC